MRALGVDPDDPAFSKPTKPIGPFMTREEAEEKVREKGWTVMEERPAPTLVLDSDGLGLRYATDAAGLHAIGKTLSAEFGEPNAVFRFAPVGFQADLRYRTVICRARA